MVGGYTYAVKLSDNLLFIEAKRTLTRAVGKGGREGRLNRRNYLILEERLKTSLIFNVKKPER
jgi:hypothetical protein